MVKKRKQDVASPTEDEPVTAKSSRRNIRRPKRFDDDEIPKVAVKRRRKSKPTTEYQHFKIDSSVSPTPSSSDNLNSNAEVDFDAPSSPAYDFDNRESNFDSNVTEPSNICDNYTATESYTTDEDEKAFDQLKLDISADCDLTSEQKEALYALQQDDLTLPKRKVEKFVPKVLTLPPLQNSSHSSDESVLQPIMYNSDDNSLLNIHDEEDIQYTEEKENPPSEVSEKSLKAVYKVKREYKKKRDKLDKTESLSSLPRLKLVEPKRRGRKPKLKATIGEANQAKQSANSKGRRDAYNLFLKVKIEEFLGDGLDEKMAHNKAEEEWQTASIKMKLLWERKVQQEHRKNERNKKITRKLNKSASIPSETLKTLRRQAARRSGTAPVDAAAHLRVLGESLALLGSRLVQHVNSQNVAVIKGVQSVILDSLLCGLGILLPVFSQIPELKDACPAEVQSNVLDNVAYIMPGF